MRGEHLRYRSFAEIKSECTRDTELSTRKKLISEYIKQRDNKNTGRQRQFSSNIETAIYLLSKMDEENLASRQGEVEGPE